MRRHKKQLRVPLKKWQWRKVNSYHCFFPTKGLSDST